MIYNHKNGLSLRKLDRHELDDLKSWKGDSWTTQHRSSPLNDRDQDRFFARTSDSNVERWLTAWGEPGMVGILNVSDIDWTSRCADVGMMANPDCRGLPISKGLPEAVTDFGFEVLNLRRLQAEVMDNNPAALKFDIALGYRIEGRRRQSVYKSGHYHDSLLIAMLREEWEQSERVKGYGGTCNRDYRRRKPIDRLIARIT